MPILLLGSDNLAAPLRQLGRRVIYCGPEAEADLVIKDPDPEWSVLNKALEKIKPSVILLCDNIGARRLPTGLWGADAPTLFYGLDAPLNSFWQSAYAGVFDIACLDQKPQVEQLDHPCSLWLPVGIDERLYQAKADGQLKPGVCFVGVVDEKIRPKRSAILRRIQQVAQVEIQGGRQQSWFPTSQAIKLYQDYTVTLNENLFCGVTTRPLEVMASGGCLFTERAPGQMDEFFIHKEHLYYYGPDDIKAGLQELMADEDMRRRLRAQGRQAVMGGHTLRHRAEGLLQWLDAYAGKRPLDQPRALAREAEALLMAGLRWPGQDGARRVLRARGRLRTVVAACPNGHNYALLAQAEAAHGQWGQVVSAQNQAVALSPDADENRLRLLNLGLAYHYNRQASQAREVWRKVLGLEGEPGAIQFHVRAAELLSARGRELTPGFNRQGLWPGCWYALEHLLCALSLSQASARGEILFKLGQLLLRNQAPNQAFDCFSQAAQVGFKHEQLADLTFQAGRQGYVL